MKARTRHHAMGGWKLAPDVTEVSRSVTRCMPGLSVMVGGAIMASLWPLFTSLHGPTSYNEERHFLGQDPLFWGAMTEGVPSLLIAAGLALLSPVLWQGAPRAARIGYPLLLVSLVVPGVIDLLILATVPPLLYPLEAVGLVLLAWAAPVPQGWARGVLVAMAALLRQAPTRGRRGTHP